MKNPRTVYEVLQMLEDYHDRRRSKYERLSIEATESFARILLEHLVGLEDHSLKVIRSEMMELDPQQSTWLTSGPIISRETTHAADCHCDDDPTFAEALA